MRGEEGAEFSPTDARIFFASRYAKFHLGIFTPVGKSDKKGILTMDDKTLYNQQVERLRQKEAECFLTFLDRYSTLLKLARENNFSGEDCYRVVEAFLRMDSTE